MNVIYLAGRIDLDCALTSADHIHNADFKTLLGLKEKYHDRTKELDSELHITQHDQGADGEQNRRLWSYWVMMCCPPQLLAATGMLLVLDLVARKQLARKHTTFYNVAFSEPLETKAVFKQKPSRKCCHTIALAWLALLLDRLRGYVLAPSFCLQGVEKRATLGPCHHFQGHSGNCAY